MKRYITFVLVAMSLVGLVACSNDNGIAAHDGEAQVALRFESSSMTRADVAGINNLNENLIKTIDCYFYPAEANEDTPAVWHQQFDFVDEDKGIAGEQSSATVTDILMPSGEMNAIFGTGTTGKIYAIANYAGGSALPTSGEGTSVANLKDMVVTTAWLDTSSKFQKQTSFVMDSEMVEITKDGNTIKRNEAVPLTRTAAKVELTITGVAESAKDAEGNVWVPNITVDDNGVVTGANVTMYNARTTSSVGGAVQAFEDGTHPELTGYGFSNTDKVLPYKQTNPFYTYPHAWTSSEQEAYLLLVVNWKKQSDNSTANCYYEIPIGAADNKAISRNHIYQIGINVGTLGSFVKEDPVQLTPSYMVVDWGTGNISAKIKGQRYLVVDQNKVEIFNQTSGSVNYSTSHPVTVEIISVEKPNFLGKVASKYTYYPSGNNKQTVTPTVDDQNRGNTNPFTIVGSNGIIELSHTLVNDNNSNAFDFGIYTVKVKIYHTDAPTTFYEEITFLQYPAMYIEAYLNSDYKNDNNKDNDNAHKGYVWVNNSQTSSDSSSYLGGVNGIGSATNANPNMYVITTTALSSGSNYMIADPRAAEYDNYLGSNSNTWSASSAALYPAGSSNRRLSYYYPAGVTSANTEQFIAPKFRVASSYGVTYQHSYDEMRRRCASYQEDGYPAGRWRMPTAAEVKYIVSLSAKGIIPLLFNNNDEYACAEGYIIANNGTVTYTNTKLTSGLAVRCVYDDWYWGSDRVLTTDTQKQVFTWGDMPR